MSRDIVITPRSWSPRGEAEVSVRGRPLRMWAGIVGESARARVVEVGQHSDYAVFKDTTTPSPYRVQPPCDRYHVCGGCPFMHMNDEGQAVARRQLVLDALAEEHVEGVKVGQLVPSPDGPRGYRHVVKLGVGWSDLGRLRIGAWGRHSRSIVPIPECPVAAPVLRKVMNSLAHHVIDMRIPPYDSESDKGVLRSFVLRSSRASGEVLLTVIAGQRHRSLQDLATAVMRDVSEVVGVALHYNDDIGNAMFMRDAEGAIPYQMLDGRSYVDETLNDVVYRVGVGDFFQTNPGMAEVLYRETLTRLRLDSQVPLIDLYCGVGGLALAAAKVSPHVVGVEEVVGAVEAAREGARRNGVRAEFIASKVEEALPALARRYAEIGPLVTVNPARRGLEPGVIEGILALKPRRVAYISCNPRALARDLAAFQAAGMQVAPLEIYDMFPNTPHVETVAILTPSGPEAPTRRAPRRTAVGRGDRSANS
jgi:23S rRNA (uracil1939-C5)-methyltransferase